MATILEIEEAQKLQAEMVAFREAAQKQKTSEWLPALTGYENKTIDIELVKDVDGYMENVGCCERCGTTESEEWFIRHWLNNGLMDHTGLCKECAAI